MCSRILTALLSVFFITAFTETVHARQNIQATLQASPAKYSGRCPKKITFNGQIRATQPGMVQYKFIRSDGAFAPVKTLDFDRPGIKNVSTTWTLGGPGFPNKVRWQAIQVVYPQNVTSNKALFSLHCQDQQNLPDLVVEKIWLNKECRVVVKVKNIGRGALPDTVWTNHHPKSAGVYLHVDGNKWGGATIWGFDPAKKLKFSGGSAIYTSKLKVANTANIKAEVDIWNVVKESNERNNHKSNRLSCKQSSSNQNDLSVTIGGCPKFVKSGQLLNASFKVQGKSSFAHALNSVVVDIILSSNRDYASPAPYAVYSPNYSDDVLLLGGREHIAFGGPGTHNVKLNGSNKIPSDTRPGTYYLGAVIDSGNNVRESNERNNVSFCKLQVTKDE